MNTYLAIITTVLVITQIIRVVQNHISLRRTEKEILKNVEWIKDNDISERDFVIQREVFRMLYWKLKEEMEGEEDK